MKRRDAISTTFVAAAAPLFVPQRAFPSLMAEASLNFIVLFFLASAAGVFHSLPFGFACAFVV